jgi:SP family sugar:H+ symporter-like MFS transporter
MGVMGRPLYSTFLASTAALGGFLFGFDSAVINGAVSGIQRSFHSSSAGTRFAVASILLGCAVGALEAGRLADRFGRRPVMVPRRSSSPRRRLRPPWRAAPHCSRWRAS